MTSSGPAGTPTTPRRVMSAALFLTFTLGTIHAFSVFVAPLASHFGAGRGSVSFSYSLALVALTAAVLLGHRVYGWGSPRTIACSALLVAGAGLVVAAIAPTLAVFWLGYGVVFGGANGIGYGFALVLAARSYPQRSGFAMGTVTAAYAVGASVASSACSWLIERHSLGAALYALALLLVVGAVLSGLLLAGRVPGEAGASIAGGDAPGAAPPPRRALLWCAYGASVLAGLMAIGHAAPIARAAGAAGAGAAMGATLIAVGNALGGVVCGWLADRVQTPRLLGGLTFASAAALLSMAVSASLTTTLSALFVVGFTYGAIIAVYPSAVLGIVGQASYPRVYGQVFTAWGVAGLLGPWLAGVVAEGGGSYGPALLVAAALAVGATVLNLRVGIRA